MKKQIIAHCSGFSLGEENLKIDEYVFSLVKKEKPKVCFFPHATDDVHNYCYLFYEKFAKYELNLSTLSLFSPHTNEIEEFILSQDIIYVGGGNTRSMLSLWNEWGLDKILKKAYNSGIILCGISAGAICWFEQGYTDSNFGRLESIACLNILKGSCNPHCNKGSERELSYIHSLENGSISDGIGIPDGVAAHFINGHLEQVLTTNKKKTLYKYSVVDGKIEINILPAKYI